MTINKIAPLHLTGTDRDRAGCLVHMLQGYAQRAGEPGLSHEVQVQLIGWDYDEAAEFQAWLNAAIHERLSRKHTGGF